jgi:hypothetical protein
MQLEGKVAVAPNSDPLVEQLALRLLALAGDQSVRTVEALAAVLTNREDAGPFSENAPPVCSPEAFAQQEAGGIESNGKLSFCRRVARRAVRRSLLDPTGGATAFHRIDASPSWSRRSLPVASFGLFLFYRL